MFTDKALRQMIFPLFIDQLLLLIVTFLSNIMIAQAGANTLSGVSLVDMINTVMFYIFIALASGGSVVISQYIGSKNKDLAQHSAAQLLSFNTLISLTVSLLLLIFNKAIINILFGSAEIQVINTASLYFFLSVFSYPFYSILQSGNAIFRSIGNTRIPMISSIIMNFLTFFGNALSIYVFHAGVFGFGISAIFGRMLAAIFVLILTLKGSDTFNIQIRHIFEYHQDIINRIIKIALPNSIENSSTNLGKLLLASLVSTFGTVQIAANGIGNTLVPISISFGLAVNLVLVTVVGQCVGANDYDQARYYIKKLLKWMFIGNAIMISAVTISLPLILKLYNLSSDISDITVHLILIHNGFGILVWPFVFGLPNALRAAGDSKFTMNISLLGVSIFRVGFSFILSFFFGLGVYAVWIAMIIDWLVRIAFNIYRYHSNQWTKYRLI